MANSKTHNNNRLNFFATNDQMNTNTSVKIRVSVANSKIQLTG
ncbi:hypothetical protein [Pleomorphovibrio marinus]|nr:hypothetical protein [Pleomorphovibrio marinus]